jgi:hypothetical protein
MWKPWGSVNNGSNGMETTAEQAELAHPPRPCMATIGGGAEVAHSLEFDPLLDLLESR